MTMSLFRTTVPAFALSSSVDFTVSLSCAGRAYLCPFLPLTFYAASETKCKRNLRSYSPSWCGFSPSISSRLACRPLAYGARHAVMTTDFRATPIVIIGGGPTGYAAALFLAHLGWSSVSLVERINSYDVPEINSGRLFSFLVTRRALNLLSLIPDLVPTLRAEGINLADVDRITHMPSGETQRGKMSGAKMESSPSGKTPFWLHRTRFMQILSTFLQTHYGRQVQLFHGCECKGFDIQEDGLVNVSIQQLSSSKGAVIDNEPFVLKAALVLACDGVSSAVREWLCSGNSVASESTFQTGSRVVESFQGFDKDYRTSPAVGLRYRSLTLPPRPVVAAPFDVDEECAKALPKDFHVFVGKKEGRKPDEVFSLGCFPVGTNDSCGRIATLVRKPDHAIWKLSNIEDAYKFFEENFPQMRVRDLISPSEMSRFVEARPSLFPSIQRCRSLTGRIHGRKCESGVALLGDAAHCFPPDLGLGLNSAMEDVLLFCNELEKQAESEHSGSLHEALKSYELDRDEDISALMRMMVVGGPYQYGQDIAKSRIWILNLLLRSVLSKYLPNLFSPAIFELAGGEMRFSEIMKQADATTNRLIVLVVSLVFALSSVFVQLYLAAGAP